MFINDDNYLVNKIKQDYINVLGEGLWEDFEEFILGSISVEDYYKIIFQPITGYKKVETVAYILMQDNIYMEVLRNEYGHCFK